MHQIIGGKLGGKLLADRKTMGRFSKMGLRYLNLRLLKRDRGYHQRIIINAAAADFTGGGTSNHLRCGMCFSNLFRELLIAKHLSASKCENKLGRFSE